MQHDFNLFYQNATKVLWNYPDDVSKVVEEFKDIPEFCFPGLIALCANTVIYFDVKADILIYSKQQISKEFLSRKLRIHAANITHLL